MNGAQLKEEFLADLDILLSDRELLTAPIAGPHGPPQPLRFYEPPLPPSARCLPMAYM